MWKWMCERVDEAVGEYVAESARLIEERGRWERVERVAGECFLVATAGTWGMCVVVAAGGESWMAWLALAAQFVAMVVAVRADFGVRAAVGKMRDLRLEIQSMVPEMIKDAARDAAQKNKG